MKTTAAPLLSLSLGALVLLWSPQETPEKPITNRVLTTEANERILAEEVWIEAPVEVVWAAYTTVDGWTAWASPQAEIDLRVGGTIRTHYEEGAAIGDPGTNTLHIVNYVPLELLTLRADVSENWPEILKRDADNLSNVILFESLGPERTRIRSFGMGYGDAPEYDDLLQFFAQANAGLFEKLKRAVEQ